MKVFLLFFLLLIDIIIFFFSFFFSLLSYQVPVCFEGFSSFFPSFSLLLIYIIIFFFSFFFSSFDSHYSIFLLFLLALGSKRVFVIGISQNGVISLWNSSPLHIISQTQMKMMSVTCSTRIKKDKVSFKTPIGRFNIFKKKKKKKSTKTHLLFTTNKLTVLGWNQKWRNICHFFFEISRKSLRNDNVL